jgi:hypothetical protein
MLSRLRDQSKRYVAWHASANQQRPFISVCSSARLLFSVWCFTSYFRKRQDWSHHHLKSAPVMIPQFYFAHFLRYTSFIPYSSMFLLILWHICCPAPALLVKYRHGPHRKHRSIISVQLLPWKHTCLRSRYLATAIVYLLIPQSFESTCYDTNAPMCSYNIYLLEFRF